MKPKSKAISISFGFRHLFERIMRGALLITLFGFLFQPLCFSSGPPTLEFTEDSEKLIYYVPQFSDFQQISIHEMHFLKQILEEAEENHVKAVIFEIDTPGGRVDVALKYVSILAKSKVPTIAFVNPQAISAGMIIALAADRIAINPSGTIGDAMPIQMTRQGARPITDYVKDKPDKDDKDKEKEAGEAEGAGKVDSTDPEPRKSDDGGKNIRENFEELRKMINDLDRDKGTDELSPEEKKLADQKFLTVYFKVLQVLAEKNKRPVRVIRAMADPYQKLSKEDDGFEHTKVSPLTLSAVEAKQLAVIDYICRDKSELRDELGLSDCEIVVKDKSPTHYIIFLLSHPFISGLLIMLGIVGLYIEARTPGFGFAGGVGITAMVLFFVGHAGIGNSDWVPSVIFLIGIVLLALEIFVIPGFGIAGVSGIIAIFASMLLAFGWERLELALNTMGIAMVLATIIIVLLTIYVLPRSALFRKITLNTSHNNTDGFSSHKKPDLELVGKEGIVHSALRPTGLAIIDGRRLDVMTEGDFIAKGEKIKVTQANGMRIIVDKA